MYLASSLPLYPGHSLTQFVRHCADHFLNSEHKEIRMEAARTCSRLLTPSVHLISGHAHVVSQTAVQVVADVLSKLLVVGITDPGKVRGAGAVWGGLDTRGAGNSPVSWHALSKLMSGPFSARALGLAAPASRAKTICL